uniref:Uncharacterized protein n=1 Tax=Lepeophtheirus salmonis TaxID=72036 RepID=A0A0K2VA60_LEPSM
MSSVNCISTASTSIQSIRAVSIKTVRLDHKGEHLTLRLKSINWVGNSASSSLMYSAISKVMMFRFVGEGRGYNVT